MASWAPKGDAEQMEARAAHCYVLLDWMRVAVLPTIRGDVHRLSSTLDTLQRAAGVARQPNSSGTTTAEGRLQEFLELVALDLCPAQHRRILLRHVAAFSHQLAQRIKAPSTDRDSSSSQKMQLLLPMFQYVSRDDVPTEERSHWITRLLIRLSDLPLGPLHDSVSAAAAASRHHWLSNIVVEVACAILCKIIGSTQASPNSTAPFFAKLLVLSIGTSSNGLRPGACFLVNSLRMSHPDAFRCVESVLGAPQRDALNSLHAYCTALESIASTPAELAAVTTAVISEEVDRFVNLYQEVLAEVSAMASEADQKGSTKPSVEEDLPELGAERNTNQASIAAPTATGNSLIQEAGAITSELSSWVQDHINALRQRMSERLQDGGAATWFDRTMWYVERSVTDLNAALPSAHPDAKGSTLLHAITTTNELVTSTREGLQRILSDTRNKANTARLCSQLSELLTHTCQCIRQDVSPAFRRASHDLRRVVEDHVAPWFNASQGTTLDTSNNASATLRTIDELFEGRIPAVLQRPIPVAFATQGTNESVSWKLDINFIDLNRSQECPRKIRFRGSRTTTAVPLGGSKSSRKQIHFTQTFILKGCQASDSVGRDHVVMALLRELQFLQHHANNGRVHNGSSLSVEQWMEGHVHPAPSAHATFTPCFAVYPFAGGGGLAEVLHGTNAVSALVDQWRSSAREDFMKSTDDSRMPLPLSLGAPATQFQETLKLVVDEFNVRQQEARSRQRSNPRDRNAQDKQPPPTAFVDLNRPPPELIRETYLRLLRAQPSSRECISNAIFAEVRYDDATPHRSVLPSDFAWVQRWSTYMRSLATGCALSYVLGIGDRHLGNILLCSEESLRKGRSQQKKVSSDGVGLVAHVDFSVCFGAGAKLRFPERIPFRMSPVFMHPLGAYGTEGGFAEVLRQVLTTVHQNESFILETTDALRWLVPLSGPVRKGPLATIANSSKHANNTSVVLRGSMVAVIDRVADRVHRQMDSLYAALMTVTQKHPSGQWMAIRNQIHQNSKFHSIASTGRRLTALTVESKTLRTEDDVDADASNITTRIAANKTLLNNAYDEFQDVVRSSQRVMNRLREVTSQIACEGRKWLDQPPNESSLLECALSIGLGIPPGLIVSTSKQPSPAHEDSLWQTASPIKVDGPLTVKGGRSISIGAWEAYLPSMAQQSGITSLLGGSATVAKQRLLQRDFVSRQLMKLLETISSGAYDSSLLAGIQQEVEELQRNAQRRPSVDAADTIPCSLSAASHLAANLETDQPLPIVDDATGRMMELCSQWFATIRRVQWTNHQTASFSKVALDNVVANFTEQLLNSMPDEVYDEEILRSAIATAATVASHPLNESTSLTSVAPFQFQEALVTLVKSLFSEASDEVAVNAVRNVCTRETVHTIAALFCIECLSHSPINIAAQRNVWKQHFSETLVASRQQVLEALDGVTEGLIRLTSAPESCSKSEQVLGELAGLPCVSAASDVLRRFDDVVEEITTDLWSRVANASHEALLLDRQLNDVHAERSRIRQRSAVVFNEHRLMTELLRQSLTPVTLNPLSLVVRQVQVCLEGLYKELHTDLAETVLPRLLQRAGGTPSLARSPMQLAAHLIQRSEQEIVNILNMTHQLITEGYEELATLISRGATAIASRRLTDSEVTSRGERSTLQTDVEIASYIERLLVVTDSIFITASVSMFSHIDRLFSLLSSFGSHCASERLPRIRAMLEQLRTVADKVMLSGSSAELASSWGGQQGRKVNQIERLAEQLLRPQVPSTESFIHDAKIAVAHGDIHQLLDDLKKRIRIMAQDAQQRLPGQSPTYCVAPPPVKFLVQASIDADALSAMYPGWTAWI
ncbi:Hypothetical protein, putative [Bodo saltans]|uniref:PI3K/PI4K catalytic domain-containing protein n=1 Tax=Bodo saltans TaxID=75058 RepID=A0A0S4J208_BODSA|nr:Hypothetical protein, putative [Bodo saltans]|eukprot:CUG83804.1 Hypothetical protein, putative [Bodo saltans]